MSNYLEQQLKQDPLATLDRLEDEETFSFRARLSNIFLRKRTGAYEKEGKQKKMNYKSTLATTIIFYAFVFSVIIGPITIKIWGIQSPTLDGIGPLPPPSGMLFVQGNTIKGSKGEVKFIGCTYQGYRVYGQSFNIWEYAEEHSRILRSIGLNCVRLPFYWNFIEVSTSPFEFKYNIKLLDNIEKAVKTFIDAGFYVILDVHTHDDLERTGNLIKFLPVDKYSRKFKDEFYTGRDKYSAREHLKNLWLLLSSRFKDDDLVFAYELLNEPHYAGGSLSKDQVHKNWYEIQDYVISHLRQTGDRHIVISKESPYAQTFQYMTGKLYDDNVVYGFPFYSGLKMEGTYTVERNDLDFLINEYAKKTANIRDLNAPYMIMEYGNLYHNYKGDKKDFWIENTNKLFSLDKNLDGFIWFTAGCNKYGEPWSLGTWINRLLQMVKT